MFGLSSDETLIRLAVILSLKNLSMKVDEISPSRSINEGYNRVSVAVKDLHILITEHQPTRKELLTAGAAISAEAMRFIVDIVLATKYETNKKDS